MKKYKQNMKEYAANMKKYRFSPLYRLQELAERVALSLYIDPETWKNSEVSPYISSETWENSDLSPVYRSWDFEKFLTLPLSNICKRG